MMLGHTIIMGIIASLVTAINVRAEDQPKIQSDIAALVQDLHSDDVRFNADKATRRLREIGLPAVDSLETALESDDYQQRQFAADVLREIKEYKPSRVMLDVTVEGLRHDTVPCGYFEINTNSETSKRKPSRSYNYVFNAADGTRFLLNHAESAEPFLVAGLDSDDLQQRFLCAFILGYGGRTASTSRIAEILLPHLRDNETTGDARLATPALYRLGVPVLPDLYEALPDADDQQQNLLELIIYDITYPPQNDRDLYERRTFNQITKLCYDPAFSGRFIDVPIFKCACETTQ